MKNISLNFGAIKDTVYKLSAKEIVYENASSENKKENSLFKEYYDIFIFNEIEDQMNFNIDINKIEKLPCGHPNLNSQTIIVNMYYDYIKKYIDSLYNINKI
jgi:hypothetical protein